MEFLKFIFCFVSSFFASKAFVFACIIIIDSEVNTLPLHNFTLLPLTIVKAYAFAEICRIKINYMYCAYFATVYILYDNLQYQLKSTFIRFINLRLFMSFTKNLIQE